MAMKKGAARRKTESSPTPQPAGTLPGSIVNAFPVSLQIMHHMAAIEKLVPHIEKDLKKAEKSPVTMARAFVAFHRMMDRVEAIFKPAAALYDLYKKERIPALFEQAGVPNVSLDEGFRVGLSHKYFASIKGDKENPDNARKLKDAAYQWLRENGLADIIATTVNSQTLSAAGKELLETKNVELPSDFFNVAMVPNTSVTKI